MPTGRPKSSARSGRPADLGPAMARGGRCDSLPVAGHSDFAPSPAGCFAGFGGVPGSCGLNQKTSAGTHHFPPPPHDRPGPSLRHVLSSATACWPVLLPPRVLHEAREVTVLTLNQMIRLFCPQPSVLLPGEPTSQRQPARPSPLWPCLPLTSDPLPTTPPRLVTVPQIYEPL